MPVLSSIKDQLTLPVLCSPMFIVSTPALVFAQCTNGIIGSFPALNARGEGMLEEWLTGLEQQLEIHRAANPEKKVAPFAVNQIVHQSNTRLDADFDVLERHKVPLVITSLRAPTEYVPRIHAWGGRVLHDVTNIRHAEKALEAGVDGLILVCAGAGGHSGALSPMALVSEVRRIYDGLVVLAGSITRGEHILAALAMGADLAYMGTRFIATEEANAVPDYKRMIVEAGASDILYTPYFSSTHGNYLKPSIRAAGLDPDNLVRAPGETAKMAFISADGSRSVGVKTWKDIWSAGHGVGAVDDIPSVTKLVARLQTQLAAARAHLCASL
ncbi:nitronate monooxygenase [Steroidobacter denitrificans]|uniref:Nitronate monooxygenase n=2 Tax=Steroidobacter denitrificans TaxID=465721 RepID=A0A127F755_STEDE|nr:nitronate monooxygenase family protein [Steroidobacter denitrificans]AMN46273.1 nitronate monooxygenase [Steroidobacter denitrificans]